jgi:hypothetical protein
MIKVRCRFKTICFPLNVAVCHCRCRCRCRCRCLSRLIADVTTRWLCAPGLIFFNQNQTWAQPGFYVHQMIAETWQPFAVPGAKNGIFFGVFPMFVPSLSWQKDHIYI